MSDDRCDLQKLCQAIVDHTGGDGFWIGEILLDTIKRETGYKYEPAVYQEERCGLETCSDPGCAEGCKFPSKERGDTP